MKRAPVLFVGHGSPMNAIEHNMYTAIWDELGQTLPRPKAIVSLSAHWFTAGTRISDVQTNRTIYDMYGFPDALYRVVYEAPGEPALARRVQTMLGIKSTLDSGWGLDHGTWSVLTHLYPKADIPVFQVSIDGRSTTQVQFEIGRALRDLRDEGVMIFASGNVVHHLGKVDFGMQGGFPWADQFDAYIRDAVVARDFEAVLNYEKAGASARFAVPTTDHFAPLVYALGAVHAQDELTVFNDERVYGALSMTGYLFA